MRKLTKKVTVSEIFEIPNSDFLVGLRFEESGWSCVTTKNSVKVGDTGVYFEVDSLLPMIDSFQFLEKSGVTTLHTGEKGYRLKTIKLRGQISQGLFLTWDKLPELDQTKSSFDEDLGVLKYERPPEISMEGDIIGFYPGHTPKSNQERIQNLTELFEVPRQFELIPFERTLKMEGMSVSLIHLNGKTNAASHNTVYEANERFDPWKYFSGRGIDKRVEKIGKSVTIQGEFIGPKIQGNIEKLRTPEFLVYNIFDIEKGQWMSQEERFSYLEEINKDCSDNETLNHVPLITSDGKLIINPSLFDASSIEVFPFAKENTIESLLLDADGKSIHAPRREGDVYKSKEPVNGSFIQFKVISNAYLLKEK